MSSRKSQSLRPFFAATLVVLCTIVVAIAIPKGSAFIVALGVLSATGTLLAPSPRPRGLKELPSVIGNLLRGKAATLPAHSAPEVLQIVEVASSLATPACEFDNATVDALCAAIGDLARGRAVGFSSALRTRASNTFPNLISNRVESSASSAVQPLWDEIESAASRIRARIDGDTSRITALRRHIERLDASVGTLDKSEAFRSGAAEGGASSVKTAEACAAEIARTVEALGIKTTTSVNAVTHIANANERVASMIVDVANNVRETAASIEEMTYAIREVAKNADTLSLTAEETSSSMEEMDASIEHVQNHAVETARLSVAAARDAAGGADAMMKTIAEIERIEASTMDVVDVMSNLVSRIRAIGQILDAIDDVVEQTNLLSLNASIIAMQAGDHGRGFAVVANEIKSLAERAADSTKEIGDMMLAIQTESERAIELVGQCAKNVTQGVEVSSEARRALEKILESVEKSTEMVESIARATTEQSHGSRLVTSATSRLAETVRQIASSTSEQARGSESIMHNVDRMRAIASRVELSSREQSCGSSEIVAGAKAIALLLDRLSESNRAMLRNGSGFAEMSDRMVASTNTQETAHRRIVESVRSLREVVL